MLTRRAFVQAGIVIAGAPRLCLAQEAERKLTESNVEGPFYRKDAPWRSELARDIKGEALVIKGRVTLPDGTPLREAVVDIWHADGEGIYDNNSDKFILRGRMRTDKEGLYACETIMPGQYDEGESRRPAHIHYKVKGEGARPLTTQLYFKGDKYLEKDRLVRKSLIIEVKKGAGTFDIVLAKA